jgi:predicted nucleic acid-binding protein
MSLLSQLPIVVQHDSPEKTLKDFPGLARSQDLSSYDASYLNLAMARGLPLATLDKKLRKAAESVNVKIIKE